MDEPLIEEISRSEPLHKLASQFKSQKFPANTAVIGVSITLLLASLYLLTRPCVIGTCQEIKRVQALTQNTLTFLEIKPSMAAIVTARQQLRESIKILKTIPWWSKSYPEATILLAGFQEDFKSLDRIINAFEARNNAIAFIDGATLPIEKWQEIAIKIKAAIADLNQVYFTGNLAPLLNHKIQEYQKDLVFVEQRLVTEQQAIENLPLAKEAANSAKVREINAQSLADWQSVHDSWQAAIQ
jgi:hypothetical protein